MNLFLLKIILINIMFVLTVLAGITPIKWLRRTAALAETSQKQRLVSLLLCLLTCFSGGVFFATCFLHLLPELYDQLEHIKSFYDYKWNYPVAELCSCFGFFFLFFFEELFLHLIPSLGHGHAHSPTILATPKAEDESSCSTALAEPERCETNCKSFKHNPPILMKRRPHAHSHGIRSVTFVIAISFHSVVEGLALGVQNSHSKVLTIFFSLMIHKLIVAFSVGLQLARTHAHAIVWVCFSILLFGGMTPFGALLGIFVQNAQLDALLKDWIILIMQGIAVGTFLYVTFFEVLIHERDNEHPNLLKLFIMIVGFTLIGLIRLMANGHSHEIDQYKITSKHKHMDSSSLSMVTRRN